MKNAEELAELLGAEVVGKDFPLKEGVNFLTKPFQAAKLAQIIRTGLDG